MPQGIVHAASEVVGFAKTGGLADVAGALPRALARHGYDCAIIAPLYRATRAGKIPLQSTTHAFTLRIGARLLHGRIWQATLPHSSVPVYLIEQPDLFERDDPVLGRGLYQLTLPDGRKCDYPDNCERFIFFSRAVLETLRLLDLWPDVLHCHDWQTGLVPVYLAEEYRRHPLPALRREYQHIRTVFTIHNIAYQGLFPFSEYPATALDVRLFNYHQLEFYGQWNSLKAGLVFADWLTTVSPTYAEEIQTPDYGCGLQGVLLERRHYLSGIVNGVEYRVWNPATDPHIAANYDPATVVEGKAKCKAALQQRFGLAEESGTPVLAMIARLVEQKGVHLLTDTADTLLTAPPGAQLVVLGEGDPVHHRRLQELRARHPERVGLLLGFDEKLAHEIEAGADIYLMPSQYEPSGLNQLYSLKYGTPPVVRATGGLVDTITDCTPPTLADGSATGFRFVAYTPAAFQEATQRALELYRGQPEAWLKLMRNGMAQDWSWERSAVEYEKLYCQERDEL
jgi:starch synthase